MKQIIPILAVGATIMTVTAVNRTLFIYHSDGIEPILFAEIDSIRMSYIDVDSTQLNAPLVQEFWTADSVYRYRTADIDSVSFQNPPTILQPRAIDLAQELSQYVDVVDYTDAMTLSLKSSTPSSLMPQAGDYLFQLSPTDNMPYGFAGKVESVEGYTIHCSDAGPDEIFRSIAFTAESETEAMPSRAYAPAEESMPWYAANYHIPQQTANIMTDELRDIPIGAAQAYVSSKVRIRPVISCQTGIYVLPTSSDKPMTVQRMHSAVTLDVEASANGRCILEKEITAGTGESVTIRSTGLGLGQKFTAKFSGSIKASGTMGIDYNYNASYTATAITSIYEASDTEAAAYAVFKNHVKRTPVHELSASMDGKISLNCILSLTVTNVTDSLKSVSQTYTYGSSITGDALYRTSELDDAVTSNALYKRITATGVKGSPVESLSSSAKYAAENLKLKSEIKPSAPSTYYAVPKFTFPTYADGTLTYKMDGLAMKGVSSAIGVAVQRTDKTLTYTTTQSVWPATKTMSASPSFSIDDGDIVYPTATLGGKTILCSPTYPATTSALTPIIFHGKSGGVRIVSGWPYYGKGTSGDTTAVLGTPLPTNTDKKK